MQRGRQIHTQSALMPREGRYEGSGTKVVTYGQQYGNLLERQGRSHTFEGWWTGVDGSGYLVDADSLVSTVTDRTLHAKWTFNVYTGPAGGLVVL
jgi:hypothetical protein